MTIIKHFVFPLTIFVVPERVRVLPQQHAQRRVHALQRRLNLERLLTRQMPVPGRLEDLQNARSVPLAEMAGEGGGEEDAGKD